MGQVQFSRGATGVRVVQEAVGAGVDRNLRALTEKKRVDVMAAETRVILDSRLGIVPDSSFKSLPVAVVEGLELGRHVDVVVGGILKGCVNKGRIRSQVAFGEVVGAAGRRVDQGIISIHCVGSQDVHHALDSIVFGESTATRFTAATEGQSFSMESYSLSSLSVEKSGKNRLSGYPLTSLRKSGLDTSLSRKAMLWPRTT